MQRKLAIDTVIKQAMGDRHYEHAPIKEAILDIRVETPLDGPASALQNINEWFPTSFSHRHMIVEGQFSISAPEAGSTLLPTSAKQNHVGYRFVSDDGKYVCQIHLNGFALSRLAPYET